MSIKFAKILYPILLLVNYSSRLISAAILMFDFQAPRTCRTQPPSGAPLIMATKNLLAMTEATVRSANIDGRMAQRKIEKMRMELRENATIINEGINRSINETLNDFLRKMEDLFVDEIDLVANECARQSSLVKSTAAKILAKANFCVSNTAESIEKQFNETYSSIESVLARINSDQKIAETCLAEYNSTEMALRNAIVTALCINQAKERILSAIKDDILPWNDAAKTTILSNDVFEQMISCDDEKTSSSLMAETELIYVEIKSCITNSNFVQIQD